MCKIVGEKNSLKEKMVIGLCDDEKVTHEVVKKYIENYGVRCEISKAYIVLG